MRKEKRGRASRDASQQTLRKLVRAADDSVRSDDTLVLADALEERGYLAIANMLRKLVLDIRTFEELVPLPQRARRHEDPSLFIKVEPPTTARARRLFRTMGGVTGLEGPHVRVRGFLAELERHQRTWKFLKRMILDVIGVLDQATKIGWWIRVTRSHPRGMAWPVVFLRWSDDKGRQVVVRPLLGEGRGGQVAIPIESFYSYDPNKGPPSGTTMAPGSRSYLPPLVQGSRITASLQYLREGPRRTRRW